MFSTLQTRVISTAASLEMMPSDAWARARAASQSRYFWVRNSSDHMRRISALLNMPAKTSESIALAGMSLSCIVMHPVSLRGYA